jgi:hypothetical protein
LTARIGQCCNYRGRNNHPRNEVIGQISSQFVVGEMVWIYAGREQSARLLPRRVVACKECPVLSQAVASGADLSRLTIGSAATNFGAIAAPRRLFPLTPYRPG